MSKLAKLETLDPDIVYDFIDTGKTHAISKKLQTYIFQIQWAAEIWNGDRNIRRAADKLRIRIFVKQGEKLSSHSCQRRIYDSLNYFCIDNNVAQEIWDRSSADKLEDLARLAIESNNLSVAKQCIVQANEYRARANSSMDPEKLRPPMFLISPRITAEDLGFASEKLLEITQKANEGVYAKMISGLPIESSEKQKLLADAGIKDVDFEEMEEDGSTV